jgi:hypothetical protein
MHVITYSSNFAPPHFAACGIPKNTPHGTMEGHTPFNDTKNNFLSAVFSFL